MKKIGITGNIASGKSKFESFIRNFNLIVIDSDKIVHNLLSSDKNTINEVITAFKDDDILNPDGSLSREKLGSLVFNNPYKKKILESILHPKVFDEIDRLCEINNNEKLIFISLPLLFETNSKNMFDKVIFISSEKNIRLLRLIKRNNYSEEYALLRINSQDDEEEKIEKSDYVIYNNSDLETFKTQALNIIKHLLNIYST